MIEVEISTSKADQEMGPPGVLITRLQGKEDYLTHKAPLNTTQGLRRKKTSCLEIHTLN